MEIIFKANDGKIFDNEFDCREHEFNIMVRSCSIKAYDCRRRELDRLDTQYTYCETEIIVISNSEEVRQIKEIYDYTGYYDGIDAVGVWGWSEGKQKFLQLDDETDNQALKRAWKILGEIREKDLEEMWD